MFKEDTRSSPATEREREEREKEQQKWHGKRRMHAHVTVVVATTEQNMTLTSGSSALAPVRTDMIDSVVNDWNWRNRTNASKQKT